MSGKESDKAIGERAQHFLKVLIERYIRDGQPVGSRTLAKDAGLDLSPATIRNVMADLEDMGLVASPHTSAGRVPTVSGYRLFVDSLLSLQPIDRGLIRQLQNELQLDDTPGHLLESASRLLSNVTHLAGVVSMPRPEQVRVRQIEFVPLNQRRVLAIIVTSQGEIINRIVETAKEFRRAELESFSNYINAHYAGRDLESVRAVVLREMEAAREDLDSLMSQALQMANAALDEEGGPAEGDFVVAGQTNLMDFNELAEMERLRSLFDAFTEKREILHLLDRCLGADGVQIYIGEESGYTTLKDCSVVTAPYEVGGEVVGVLGVIGPTRLAYDRVIPIVDVTAKLLGAALKPRSD